ncbi:MAG: Pr6Pr family membrane protein [Hyphomonadaceae bacterium JAD_PAG50586_4]|nr:MAG: Pr6Pr family membrane protein [Hyphomonadaceae bacterium JAD_PAG50586_4]
MSAARVVAALGALIGVVGLALQYWLIVTSMGAEGASPLEATWRYFAYFTILTNTFVTLAMARGALKPESRVGLNSPRVELMATVSILFVFAVYNLLLASRWDPQGAQKVADVIVHQIVPLTMALFWLLRPHGGLTWRGALYCALWPTAYTVYALARGQFDGFYAYYFMDPSAMSWGALALNVAGLCAAFVAFAFVLVGVDHLLAKRSRAGAVLEA